MEHGRITEKQRPLVVGVDGFDSGDFWNLVYSQGINQEEESVCYGNRFAGFVVLAVCLSSLLYLLVL